MILRIQGQGNLAGADVQKLVFVVLRATELTDNLAEGIVLRGTQTWQVVDDEVVNGEYICEFDVECWLGSCEQIVELVNLKLSFGGANIDHVGPNVLHPINGFRDVAVKRLQVEIFTTKQLTTSNLTEDLGNSSEVSVHDWR
jgi:hypothetical protein